MPDAVDRESLVPVDEALRLSAREARGKVPYIWMVDRKHQLQSVAVSREMLEETGTSVVDTDGFVNYPRAIDSAEMAIFFREMD